MKCPNCGFIDKDEAFGEPAICPKCSAIYEKALRIKQLKEQEATLPDPAPRPPTKKASPTINERLAGARIGMREAQRERETKASESKKTKEKQRVIITDIDMPFWSIVGFMVKLAIAAIPAFFIVSLIVTGIPAFFNALSIF